jgi:type IV pilus assembly protein PilW
MILTSSQKGFGLIEILVGLLIGLITTIIMFQAMAVSESQKRTTTGAADAQSNGAISLFSIERDVRMAGWGLQGSVFKDCIVFETFDTTTGGPIDSNPTPGSSLVSVLTITDGGTSPDSITIRHYDDPANQDFRFAIASLSKAMTSANEELALTSVKGCNVNDLLIVSDGEHCTLVQASAVNTTTRTITHAGLRHNPPDASGWTAHTAASRVQCIGPGLYTRTYSVDTNTYQLQLTQGADVFAVAPQIMDVQAEYGIDAGSGTAWVPATGAWANPTLDNIRRIKAARIAVLARSGTFEKPEGGGACTTTTSMAGLSTWATFDTTNLPSDFSCYRYKAYEINVPLRNVIWSRT